MTCSCGDTKPKLSEPGVCVHCDTPIMPTRIRVRDERLLRFQTQLYADIYGALSALL